METQIASSDPKMAQEHLRELRAIRKCLQSIESLLKQVARRTEEEAESFARTDEPVSRR